MALNDTGSQADQALAIALEVAADPQRAAALLLQAVLATKHHPTVGIIGNKFLHAGLAAAGHHGDALALLEQTTYPSFGYQFANTLEPASENIWELWDSPFEGTGMNSRNHHMFSSYSHFLVTVVGGITEEPGHLRLRPALALDVAP